MNLNLENSHKLSGFILKKDVYTTNILYENNLIPDTSKLKYILPFRPKSGRIPQDPSTCIRIMKQIYPIPFVTNIDNIFFIKKNLKSKKLKNKKLKFPLPKMKLRPISSNDFYTNIRGKRARNIEDDLNITTRHGKKIYYSFKNDNDYEEEKKYKEKYVRVGNIFNNNGKKYDEYFDFGFHINKNNDNFQIKNKRIKSATKLRVKDRKGLLTNNKYYQKDNTFKTQIDYNLFYSNKNYKNRRNIDKF
jgi:hypothetical protein